MRAATVVQQLWKSHRTCFKFYCMFYFTCDRSLSVATNIHFVVYLLSLSIRMRRWLLISDISSFRPQLLRNRRLRCMPMMYISAFNWYVKPEKSERQICTWTATTSSFLASIFFACGLVRLQPRASPSPVGHKVMKMFTSERLIVNV